MRGRRHRGFVFDDMIAGAMGPEMESVGRAMHEMMDKFYKGGGVGFRFASTPEPAKTITSVEVVGRI